MSSFQLDQATGDLLIVNNSLSLTTGLEAIRQHMQCRFRLFLGEWFLDESLGVPYYQDILVKKPSFNVVQEVLKNTALETVGVIELTQFNFEYDANAREANLDFRCLTEEGFIDFSQIVEI